MKELEEKFSKEQLADAETLASLISDRMRAEEVLMDWFGQLPEEVRGPIYTIAMDLLAIEAADGGFIHDEPGSIQ